MNIKQKIKIFLIVIGFAGTAFFTFLPNTASAACSGDYTKCNNGCAVDTEIIKCDNVDVAKGGTTNNGIWSLLLTAINILSFGVGIAAVAGIVYGSILYTSAGGNSEQTKKAIEFIRNVIIGIVAYAIMFSFLNFIIPGGLFG
jgi:hypothetical protein